MSGRNQHHSRLHAHRADGAAVTRDMSTALAPAWAPAEDSPALGDLGDLIVSQDIDNSTNQFDAVPAPAMRRALPPGKHEPITCLAVQL